jgi:hypothetical protein
VRPAEMPADVREALIEIVADALVASYLRAHPDYPLDDVATLRYNRAQPTHPGGAPHGQTETVAEEEAP